MIAIRQERQADAAARERCSTRLRPGPLHQMLRSACARTGCRRQGLSFVATEDGRIVGTVRLWDVSAGPGRRALLLGPLAVAPELSQAAASAAR